MMEDSSRAREGPGSPSSSGLTGTSVAARCMKAPSLSQAQTGLTGA